MDNTHIKDNAAFRYCDNLKIITFVEKLRLFNDKYYCRYRHR